MLGGVGNVGIMSARRRVTAAAAAEPSRYARIVSESSSSYSAIYEIEFFTGANQTGTKYPDTVGSMTSATAPSPLVASSPQQLSDFYGAWKTFDNSIECLKVRGMMVSFGNASGPLDPCNVAKSLAPKGLYLTRPSIAHYTSTREELDEAANKVFQMFITKKFKLNIFKKYSLSEVVKAHQDLENRKILGPAIIIP